MFILPYFTVVLKPLYAASPEPILSRFDKLAEYMEDMNQSNKTYMYMLWDDVAKDNAKVYMISLSKSHYW